MILYSYALASHIEERWVVWCAVAKQCIPSAKDRSGVTGPFLSDDTHRDIWKEVYEWMQFPDMYPCVLWIKELAGLVVAEQKWVRAPHPFWKRPDSTHQPLGFVAHAKTHRVLLTRLPQADALDKNPIDPIYFPKTSAWLKTSEGKQVKTNFLVRAARAAKRFSVEVRYQNREWVQTGRVLGLATDPQLGPFFVSLLLSAIKPEWGVKAKKAVTSSEKAVKALFDPTFHTRYRRGFDEEKIDKAGRKRRKYGNADHDPKFKEALATYFDRHQLSNFKVLCSTCRLHYTDHNYICHDCIWHKRIP